MGKTGRQPEKHDMKFALTLKQTLLVALVIFGGLQFVPA
jgi:hypothetical protein